MQFKAHKNLTPDKLTKLIKCSTEQAVRRIKDETTGDVWYWRAELGTHAEGAKILGIPYYKKPGEGDILIL